MKMNNMVTFARLWLATLFILNACDNGSGSYNNSGSDEKYDYCVFMEQQTCLSGPFQTCANGGTPSNSCPSGYDTGSQVEKPSSSSINSGGVVNSSSSATQQTGKIEGTPITYQGQTYKTVKIGTQTWMAENLNYNVSGSKCYDNLESNCNKYGRLYDWATAMGLPASCNSSTCASSAQTKHRGICPSGWHIPTNAEWNTLSSYVASDKGCSGCDAKHLKATYDWYNNGNGLDSYGFAALTCGNRNPDGSFITAGGNAYFWSATEYDASIAWNRSLNYGSEDMFRDGIYKTYMFSVRCVWD